jgi:hypothetical protein
MAEHNLAPEVDLGLSSEEAKRGLREATGYMTNLPVDLDNSPILGMDKMLVEGLYRLLLKKGVVTDAEYDESMRITYNSELAKLESEYDKEFRGVA